MVSAEASCDLCLKEALKSMERTRIYSSKDEVWYLHFC